MKIHFLLCKARCFSGDALVLMSVFTGKLDYQLDMRPVHTLENQIIEITMVTNKISL